MMLRGVGRRLPSISRFTGTSSSSYSSGCLVGDVGPREERSISKGFVASGLQGFNSTWNQHSVFRGFAAESLAPRHELGLYDIPPTVAAVKNPTSKIQYDESNHERFAPGDPSKKAFTYFVLTGGRFVYASFIRLLILKFILSMSASKDVLAMASLEVDLSSIEPGSTVTVKWRGKPVFIRRRTEDDIKLANSVNVLRKIQKGCRIQSGLLWLVFAPTLAVFLCLMLVILEVGSVLATVHIMIFLAG